MLLQQLKRRRLVIFSSVAVAACATAAFVASRDLNWPGHVVPYHGPPMASAEPTAAAHASWAARWDGEVGLWWQHHPGHTTAVAKLPHVHPAPSAAARLLLAAQARQLAAVDVSAVLSALRKMQVQDDSSMRGCLRWYWEEKWPKDQNASFFTALSLIALERCYADQLTAEQREPLHEILAELNVFFSHEAADRQFIYPNRYLGDLVGAWLTGEIVAGDKPVDPDGKLRRVMLEAADYWTANGWGWGEHLSDTYADVCLDELSTLLVLSKRLPEDVRSRYKGLFDELLAIDDAFGGQPRVPAIRSYAFTDPPTHTSYRDRVRPLPDGAAGVTIAPPAAPPMPPDLGGVFRHTPPIGATLHERGWHDLAPPRKPVQRDVRLPCLDGVVATARVEPDVRLGSLSRYPLRPDHDQRTWGMAWQAFPVSMWHRSGEWGFLQFQSRRGDRVRAQPALEIISAYHDPSIASESAPLVTGQTFTIQRGGDVVALRVIPVVAREWDRLADRLRLVNAQCDITTTPADGGRFGIVLRHPERQVGVACAPLSAGAVVARHDSTASSGRTIDWGPTFDRGAMDKLKMIVVLWGISLDGPVDAAPVIQPLASSDDRAPEERGVEVRWTWRNTDWRLKIDPRSQQPLVQLD